MPFIPQALAALAALAVAACESSVYSVTQDRLYSPSRAYFAAGAERFRTIIRGNPFDTPQELLNELVIDDMRRGMRRADTALRRRPKFTIDTAESGAAESGAADSRPDYLVALALNPAAETDAATLCADPKSVAASPAADPPGRIEARMVFCFDGRVLSSTHGVLEGAIDPTDPRFRRMIATMTRELFPYRKYRDAFQDSMI